jgi:hypothetical protein
MKKKEKIGKLKKKVILKKKFFLKIFEKIKKKKEKREKLEKKKREEESIVDYCCNPQCFVCRETVIPPHHLDIVIICTDLPT